MYIDEPALSTSFYYWHLTDLTDLAFNIFRYASQFFKVFKTFFI